MALALLNLHHTKPTTNAEYMKVLDMLNTEPEKTINVCRVIKWIFITTIVTLIISFCIVYEKLGSHYSLGSLQQRHQIYISCVNSMVFDPVDGKVDFIVSIEDLFPERKVVKSGGCYDGERLLKVGGFVVWHGTHDLKQKHLPMTVIAFETNSVEFERGGSRYGEQRRHYYELKCPNLEHTIQNMAYYWEQGIYKQNSTLVPRRNNSFNEPRKQGVVSCSEVHVHKPYKPGGLGWVNISALIENPYGKESATISKYPMSEGEDIVFFGNHLMWYGSFNLLTNREGRLPKTMLAFENSNSKGSSYRHYYELSCPQLEKRLQKARAQWVYDEKLWCYWRLFAIVSVVASIALSIGLLCGNWMKN